MSTKILMVCLGNICRSPLAEGILKSKLDSQKFDVQSAGTASYHNGKPPDPRSIAIAKAHGIDISTQRASKFDTKHFDNYNHIFVMDNANYEHVISKARNQSEIDKVKLILEELYPEQHQEVPDPYYGSDQEFENVYQLLDQACEQLATQLLT